MAGLAALIDGFKRICISCKEEIHGEPQNHIEICSAKISKLPESYIDCVNCGGLFKKDKMEKHSTICKLNFDAIETCKLCLATYKKVDELNHKKTECIHTEVPCLYCEGTHTHTIGERNIMNCKMITRCKFCSWFGKKEDLEAHLNKPKKFEVGKHIFINHDGRPRIAVITNITNSFMRVMVLDNEQSMQLNIKQYKINCMID